MTEKYIIDNLKKIILKYDNKILDLTDEEFLEFRELDDLSKVQVSMEIERFFCIEFEMEDVYESMTMVNIIDVIKNKTVVNNI